MKTLDVNKIKRWRHHSSGARWGVALYINGRYEVHFWFKTRREAVFWAQYFYGVDNAGIVRWGAL